MSIEMENPQTPLERVDASLNLVCQIRLALSVGDSKHIQHCVSELERILTPLMDELMEAQ